MSCKMAANVVLLNCGSFNPITMQHLRMFEMARDHLHRIGAYKVVGGIVSPTHDGYGKKGLASAEHRNCMVRKALATSDWIKLDTWETEQNAWTTTRKTLEHFQMEFDSTNANDVPPSKRKKLCNRFISGNDNEKAIPVTVKLLCGGDLLESFAVPKLWKDQDIVDIVSRYGLVVITRNNSDPYKFIYESDILTKYQNNIHVVTDWIPNEISSTRIRRSLQRGESVKYLLADAVIDYIKSNDLYGSTDDNKYYGALRPSSTPTPSPNSEANIFPPSYEHVKASENVGPRLGNHLEVPVPTHLSLKGLHSVARMFDNSDSSKFPSETLV